MYFEHRTNDTYQYFYICFRFIYFCFLLRLTICPVGRTFVDQANFNVMYICAYVVGLWSKHCYINIFAKLKSDQLSSFNLNFLKDTT